MSIKKSEIELQSPGYNGLLGEELVVKGLRCNYCNGAGWFPGYDKDESDIICPVCKGVGEMDAYVSIRWKSSLDRKEEELCE